MNKQDLQIEDQNPKSPEVFMNRLRMLQSNMNRLVNQHQALLPLINLIKLLPEVNKHNQSIKVAQAKLERMGASLKEFIVLVKQGPAKQTGMSVKELTHEITETKRKLKQVQQHMKKLGKQQLYKARLRTTSINKGIESNLEGLKKDVVCFISQFKQTLGNQYKQISHSEAIETHINSKLQVSQNQFKDHVENIKREMGLLQCQLEFVRDRQLRFQLNKNKGKEQDPLILATTQHKFYLNNFVSFQQSNTDRIKYQLEVLQNDLKRIAQSKSLQKKSIEISFCRDKYHSLTNQIEGTKFRKIGELMKLENKLERMKTLFSETKETEEVERQQLYLKQSRDIGVKHNSILDQHANAIDAKFKEIQKYL